MENLGIDSKLLIAQLINFALFFFVFKKFLAKPFAKFIRTEKENAEEKEKLLAKAKTMEEKLIEREKAMRAELKKESDKYLQEAKASAQKIKDELIVEAEQEVEELKNRVKKQLDQEEAQLLKQTKEKISDLSFLVLNGALKEVLTTEMRKKVSEAIIKNSSKEIKLHEN